MAVVMVMAMAVVMAMAMVMVNFKEYQNGLDDSRIYQRGVVHGLPTFGSAIRLLSLPAG